jgi:hypothetical protein
MEKARGNSGTFSAHEIMQSRPDNVHMGSKTTSDSCDISDMIDKSGCAAPYYQLEECLGENDRNWTKCQQEVKALQVCNAALRNTKK